MGTARIKSFFSKAKKAAVKPKTKKFIEELEIASIRGSNGARETETANRIRQSLLKFGFSPTDFDTALMNSNNLGAPSFDFESFFNEKMKAPPVLRYPKSPKPRQLDFDLKYTGKNVVDIFFNPPKKAKKKGVRLEWFFR